MKSTTMKTSFILAPLALSTSLLISCENPADKTTDAEVGEAKKKELVARLGGSVKYVFTEASNIEFVGSKVNGDRKTGGFKKVTGHFTLKDGIPVDNDHRVEIDMNSIHSESDKLTEHLKNKDFFEVSKYPTSVYDITRIEKKSDTSYSVTGNLSMHGVTKSVTFPATVEHSGETAKISAEFDIKRFDWKIEYKGGADNLINDEVILRFNLEAKPE
ncbi:MAG: YceI family protein [Roseibacillus sp.]|nr:YceI family protein [Roseibacillus sp.]